MQKSKKATVLLSIFLLGGAGYIYLGKTGKGIGIILGCLLGGFLIFVPFIGLFIGIPLVWIMWLWGLIGSISLCDKINRGEVKI